MVIYVKENPKQTYHMRSESFHRRLSAMTNVRYITHDFSSLQLIKDAKCVALVTGTAGYEAALLGVPAITFGVTWYNSLHGVFPWKGDETLEQVLEFVPDQTKLQSSFDKLTRKSYLGLVDHACGTMMPVYDKDQSIKQTVSSVRDMIDEYSQIL